MRSSGSIPSGFKHELRVLFPRRWLCVCLVCSQPSAVQYHEANHCLLALARSTYLALFAVELHPARKPAGATPATSSSTIRRVGESKEKELTITGLPSSPNCPPIEFTKPITFLPRCAMTKQQAIAIGCFAMSSYCRIHFQPTGEDAIAYHTCFVPSQASLLASGDVTDNRQRMVLMALEISNIQLLPEV